MIVLANGCSGGKSDYCDTFDRATRELVDQFMGLDDAFAIADVFRDFWRDFVLVDEHVA